MAAVLRAQTISETRGFMKALVEANGERILGFTLIGAEAGEVMTVVQTAMLAGMPYTGLRDAIIQRTPTMARRLSARSYRMCPAAIRRRAGHQNANPVRGRGGLHPRMAYVLDGEPASTSRKPALVLVGSPCVRVRSGSMD